MSHSNIPNKKTVGALHLFNIIRSTKKRKRHKQSPSIKTNTLIGTSLSQHSNCFGGREILKLAEYILNEGFKIIYQQITLVGGKRTTTNHPNQSALGIKSVIILFSSSFPIIWFTAFDTDHSSILQITLFNRATFFLSFFTLA